MLGTISMSIHIIFTIAIILALIPFGSHLAHSAEYVTLWYQDSASQSTIDQYNRHWYTSIQILWSTRSDHTESGT